MNTIRRPMKLVFIYGPPGVGKLTVATELAKLTGFKLFHNHISIQFVRSVFEFGTKRFWKVTEKFRLAMIEELAKAGVDTIFTFVYTKATDEPFVKRTILTVRKHGGRIYFVRLDCDEEELVRRVNNKARRAMGKISTKTILHNVLRKYVSDFEMPFQPSLSLDTTRLPAKKSAKMIARHYKLQG